MKLPRVGDVVAVWFADHVEDGDDTINFVVYGEVVKKDRRSITVDSWAYADRKTAHDSNEKRFSIVKSAISRIAILTESAPVA